MLLLRILGSSSSYDFRNYTTRGVPAVDINLKIMSSNQRHVAEKLDLLDPDTPWRKELKIVVDKFTELLPRIRHLLFGFGNGDPADRKALPEKFLQLSGGLDAIVQQLQTTLEQLRQRKAEWESAIQSRTGDLDRLDHQVHNLLEETSRTSKELESIQYQKDQESQALRPLQLQVRNAEVELHRAQEEDDSIRQSQADETRRLRELEILLQAQEQYAIQREEELTVWSQEFEDYLKAKEIDLEHRESNIERAQVEHKEILRQVQSREIAVGKTEEEQEKTSLERTNLQTQLAHARQLCMDKDGEIEKFTNNVLQMRSDTSKELTSLRESLQERLRELRDSQSRSSQLEASHNRCVDMNAEVESLRSQRKVLQSAAQTDRVLFQNELDSQTQIVAEKNDEIRRIESEKNKEVSQLNNALDELRGAQLCQANKYTVIEKELSAKDKAIETLQHQLTQAQAEIGRLKQSHVGDNTLILRHSPRSEAQLDQQISADLELRPDDMAIELSGSRQNPGIRKRKAVDITSDSSTEQQLFGGGSRKFDDPARGLSANQHNQRAPSHSTWAIADLRDSTYVPDPPLTPAVLSRLRARFHDWDRRKIDWTKAKTSRRCVETVTSKKACVWPHGEAFQCEYCTSRKELCAVVEKEGKLTLLPTYQGG